MALFKLLPSADRRQTQLAYRVKFWPYQELSSAARALLQRQKKIYLSKAQIMERLVQGTDMTRMAFDGREYAVVWAYNNMPTEQEWKKHRAERFLACEFRLSPAIEEFAVVILSFELPSERLGAAKKGELE